MNNQVQQDIDLWEVWIEFDPYNEEHFGILYIHGEIAADKKRASLPVRKIETLSNQLILQLAPPSLSPVRTQEVLYSEPIKNLNQYTSVTIYAGSDLLTTINDIEILI